MRGRLRGLLWFFALALALALLWRRIRIVFVVHIGWLQALVALLVVTFIIYLLLDFVVDRLAR